MIRIQLKSGQLKIFLSVTFKKVSNIYLMLYNSRGTEMYEFNSLIMTIVRNDRKFQFQTRKRVCMISYKG